MKQFALVNQSQTTVIKCKRLTSINKLKGEYRSVDSTKTHKKQYKERSLVLNQSTKHTTKCILKKKNLASKATKAALKTIHSA
jgi:hypothetical protein